MLVLLFIPALLQAKVYLVSAGINNYPDPRNYLSLPVNDARGIQEVFDTNGDSETVLLTDAEATVDNITATLTSTFAKAQPDDIVIFFFSGHGYPGGFLAYDGRLDYQKVRKAMASSPSKNKMIFTDACFAGKMRQGKTKVTRQHKSSNVMLFLSSRDDETSLLNNSMEYSYFTTCLRDALAGKADANHDRTVTAQELFKYVSKYVKRLTNNRQHPVMWGNFPNEMPVIQW